MPVLINSKNKLGTSTSSKRFKEEIRPTSDASEALYALKPVRFRYNKEKILRAYRAANSLERSVKNGCRASDDDCSRFKLDNPGAVFSKLDAKGI